jgi:hypothetical protein
MIIHHKVALLPWDSKNIKIGVPRAKTVSKHTWEGVNANVGCTYNIVHIILNKYN